MKTAKIVGVSQLTHGISRLYVRDAEDVDRQLTVVDAPPYLVGIIGETITWDDVVVEFKGKVIADVVQEKGQRRGETRIRFTKNSEYARVFNPIKGD